MGWRNSIQIHPRKVLARYGEQPIISMLTNYGSIPDIAVMKMAEQDVLDPRDPTVYDWLVEITPDSNHLPRDQSALWVVRIRMSRIAFPTYKERWLYARHMAEEAWIKYCNPNKHIDNFILGGAL